MCTKCCRNIRLWCGKYGVQFHLLSAILAPARNVCCAFMGTTAKGGARVYNTLQDNVLEPEGVAARNFIAESGTSGSMFRDISRLAPRGNFCFCNLEMDAGMRGGLEGAVLAEMNV